MGVIISASGINAEATAKEFALSVRSGVQCLHFTNTSIEKACHNYAPGGVGDGSVVGVPISVNSNYIRFNNKTDAALSGIKTAAVETTLGTYIVAARAPNAFSSTPDNPTIFGARLGRLVSDPSINREGTAMYFHTSSGLLMRSGYNTALNYSLSGIARSDGAFSDWFIAVGIVAADRPTLRNVTNNKTGTTAPAANRTPSSNNIHIGMTPNPDSGGGVIDVAAFLAYNRVLSSAEIDSAVADMRKYLALKGITA